MRRVKNRPFLRDGGGGRLILRGVNVDGAAKGRPDLLAEVSEADFVRLRDEIGASAVRFLVFWEAVEPEPGAYDEGYLGGVRERVDAAGRAGLRVVVDMHQDLWGRGFGSAGAPAWTADRALYDRFRAPSGAWFLGYFAPSVAACFERLWTDAALARAFAAAWRRVASALASSDAVVAYDVMNEPFWGTGDPDRFDRRLAAPFYARVIDAIREVDPRPFVAIEPSAAANSGYPVRFVPPPRERLVFAPHFYPAPVELGVGYTRRGRAALREHVARLLRAADRGDLPLLVGEIGARRNVPGAVALLEDAWDLLDEAMIGGFHWDLGPSDDAGYGLLRPDGRPSALARAIARPHPARIAGEPIRFGWDRGRRVFELEWHEDGSASGDTVVSLPSLALPRGAAVALDDRGALEAGDARVRIPQRGGPRRLVVRAS